MILITGAAGKTGRAIIQALSAKGRAVRALVHRPEQVQQVEELGAQEALVGDMRLPETLERAVRGATAIYHICPNMSPDEVSIGQAAIAAAQAAGLERFAYHSVLHPQTEAMPHHWLKLRVEEQLFESGLAYTILQPAAYMQNVLAHWDRIVGQGVYPVPYAVEARLGMVDLQDVAAAAAIVLTEGGHTGATYELAGAEVLSQIEVARTLQEHLRRPVRAETVPIADWEHGARSAGLDNYQIETLIKMFDYYERHGFWGNAHVLRWLLRRPATTFSAFVARTAQEQLSRRSTASK
jgi:NAD(P)H dehydrogenase (quinone)